MTTKIEGIHLGSSIEIEDCRLPLLGLSYPIQVTDASAIKSDSGKETSVTEIKLMESGDIIMFKRGTCIEYHPKDPCVDSLRICNV